jgi:8-oxo-dGTP pyrophosphatase MutT (NUDIX family)
MQHHDADRRAGSTELDKKQQQTIMQLSQALHDPLTLPPRHERRASFSPSLAYGRHFGPPAPTARNAAVMILLEPHEDSWTIPLTVRSEYLPDHPGQISLPGGRLEGNETPQQAAEREFMEEMGCNLFPGEVIGELLPLYVYNSDYYVRPFLAVGARRSVFDPCPREVERVLDLPLACLAADLQLRQKKFSRGSTQWSASAIEFADSTIWGATAIILGELSALLSCAAIPLKQRSETTTPD